MIDLYEQAKTSKQHVGACSTEIQYPGVSSCITITFYFPETRGGPLLVGGHFGLNDPSGSQVSENTINSMTAKMQNLVPTGAGGGQYQPTVALVIGQMGNWMEGDLEDRKQLLYTFVDTIAPPPHRQLRTNLKAWDIGDISEQDTGNFSTADITVSITGQIVVEGLKNGDNVTKVRATDTFPVFFGFPVHLHHVQHQLW